MTVIRKCRNHATPKVFTNSGKREEGGSLQRVKIYSEKLQLRNHSSRQRLGSGLEDKEKENGNEKNK